MERPSNTYVCLCKGWSKALQHLFPALSWTAVASRDLKRRVTYLSPGALGVGGVSEPCGVVGMSEWWLNRCPHVLHFVCLDLFGTNSVQAQAVWSFGDPAQVLGMGE
jgi:hypothetical protein